MPVTFQHALTYDTDTGDVPAQGRPFRALGMTAVDFDVPMALTRSNLEEAISVSVLADQHREAYRVASAPEPAEYELPAWRRAALNDLKETVAEIDDDTPIPAEFVFLAALTPAAVESFVSRATRLLYRDGLKHVQWSAFLRDEARAAAPTVAHTALPPLDDESSAPLSDESTLQSSTPRLATDDGVFTFADLRARVHRGALRNQRTLTDPSAA